MYIDGGGEGGGGGGVSYPDPTVRNDDHRLQYDITYNGSGNEVVPVRRNVVAPIKLQRSVT